MKHKVAELEGALLDIAVALALGWRRGDKGWWEATGLVRDGKEWVPNVTPERDVSPWSSEWSHGGPIIERERIATAILEDVWCAFAVQRGALWGQNDPSHWLLKVSRNTATATGPTPLIAAMRAYVASRFGDEIEL